MMDSGKVRRPAVAPLVRGRVRELLQATPAFRELPPEVQATVAQDMVKVARHIVGGAAGDNVPSSAVLQTDRGAAELVREVDFPQFVSDLIAGVFSAIVDLSIRQMEAYAELLKEAAAAVDQFLAEAGRGSAAPGARERDYLAQRCPDVDELLLGRGRRRTKAGTALLRDCLVRLELARRADPAPAELTERAVLAAARRRMALDRQQLLATTVLMGINRIVVTSGTIEPKIVFRL